MVEPTYFVLVFGDPEENGDTVESGRYEAGDNYPPFTVRPGDLLLPYCTDKYKAYAMQSPGIGVAMNTSPVLVEYRWITFARPIPRSALLTTFDPDDQRKMQQLGITAHRAFKISKQSFVNAVRGQALGFL